MSDKLRGTDKSHFFFSSDGNDKGNYTLKRQPFDPATDAPPPHLMQYGEKPEQHLAAGQRQARAMQEKLAACGYDHQAGHRFMDFGCANGRVLRWLAHWAIAGEGWGVDINANVINWCAERMSPPFHFATTSTTPHLPFESRHFNLVFCNSVFTHIDDMFNANLLEIRRVIAVGGYLFITIVDESAVEAMKNAPNSFMNKRFSDDTDLQRFGVDGTDFLALRRGKGGLTVIRTSYFEALVSPWFEIKGKLTQTVGGLQTGYVLKRLA